MSSDAWGFIGLLLTNVFGLATLAVQNRKQSSSVEDLHHKVAPVTNGFAKDVQASLARIETRLDDHMRGHP